MKRFGSLLLALSFCLGLFSFGVFAETVLYDAKTGFDYVKIDGGASVELVKYYGLSEVLEIPEKIAGLPVVSVRQDTIVCEGGMTVTSIRLPKYLKSFSAYSISGNTALETIVLDEENTTFTLSDGVLYGNGQLILYPAADPRTEYEVLPGTILLGEGAFYGAENLERIFFPRSLRRISPAGANRSGVFEGCSSLQSIFFPPNVSTVGDYAFMGCDALQEVRFAYGDADLKIGTGAFLNCPNLKSVRLYDKANNSDSIGLEAFGFLSYYDSGVGYVVTEKVEGFTMYGVKNTYPITYAKNCGLDYVELSVTTDFMSDIRYISCTSGLTSPKFTFSATQDPAALSLAERLLPSATGVAVQSISFSVNGEACESTGEKTLYSTVLPAGMKTTEDVSVFRVTENGTRLEYVPAVACNSVGAWGYSEERVVFETDRLGTFLIVSGTGTLAGDVDGNGEVKGQDLVQMAKYLAGWDVEIDLFQSDVDGDGCTKAVDLVQLAKYFAGWDVELSPFAAKAY